MISYENSKQNSAVILNAKAENSYARQLRLHCPIS